MYCKCRSFFIVRSIFCFSVNIILDFLGICQVSSTIYNAVLYANLDIVERYNHSSVVSYVDPGRDATLDTILPFFFVILYDILFAPFAPHVSTISWFSLSELSYLYFVLHNIVSVFRCIFGRRTDRKLRRRDLPGF